MIYQPGLTVGQLSGTAGNTVARANRFSTTIGVKRHRTFRNSTYAQLQRSNFAALAALYGTLASDQIAAWEALGLLLLVTGRLGRVYSLTGPAAFMLVNKNRHVIGLDPLTTPPAYTLPDSVTSWTGTAQAEPTGTYDIQTHIEPNPLGDDQYVAFYALHPYGSVATSFARRSYKLIHIEPPGGGGDVNLTADYLDRFSPWFPGDLLPLIAVPISSEGFRGVAFALNIVSS